MEGTQLQSLLQEDPMCCRATEPMSHNDWACALEPMRCSKRRHHSEKPVHCNQRSPHSPLLEQAWVPQPRAAQPKIKQINFKWSEKLQWGITSHQSEWPSSKNLQTVSAGKSLEKREPSCSVQLLSRVRYCCNPVDCSLPGSSVHGISQIRMLEWVSISFPSLPGIKPASTACQVDFLPLSQQGSPLHCWWECKLIQCLWRSQDNCFLEGKLWQT